MERNKKRTPRTKGGLSYPFDRMKVGMSFKIPIYERATCAMAILKYKRKNGGNFKLQLIADDEYNCRVFKTEMIDGELEVIQKKGW